VPAILSFTFLWTTWITGICALILPNSPYTSFFFTLPTFSCCTLWKCDLFHSQHTSHFYFSSNRFYFYSKSPFLSLWLNTIVKYFIEFKHRCIKGSTLPDPHLCWRTRTLNFIIILCMLLFWYFTSPPSTFLLFLHTYDRSRQPKAFSEDQT